MPPDEVMPVVRTIANNFVSDRCPPEVCVCVYPVPSRGEGDSVGLCAINRCLEKRVVRDRYAHAVYARTAAPLYLLPSLQSQTHTRMHTHCCPTTPISLPSLQVITVGLNAIREVIAHCPVVLEEEGMQVRACGRACKGLFAHTMLLLLCGVIVCCLHCILTYAIICMLVLLRARVCVFLAGPAW